MNLRRRTLARRGTPRPAKDVCTRGMPATVLRKDKREGSLDGESGIADGGDDIATRATTPVEQRPDPSHLPGVATAVAGAGPPARVREIGPVSVGGHACCAECRLGGRRSPGGWGCAVGSVGGAGFRWGLVSPAGARRWLGCDGSRANGVGSSAGG